MTKATEAWLLIEPYAQRMLDEMLGIEGGSRRGAESEYPILLYDGNEIIEYPFTEAGLTAAFAASVSGDLIRFPFTNLALTSGITIPAGVAVEHFKWSFSGFAGAAVTLSNSCALRNGSINHDGTGEATATGLFASGIADATVLNVRSKALNATTNKGVDIVGSSLYNGVSLVNVIAQGFGGTTAIGLVLGNFTYASWSSGEAAAASGSNIGMLFASTSSGDDAGLAQNSIGIATDPSAVGCGVDASRYGRATSCYFNGAVKGLVINASAVLELNGCYWNSITITGTLTYLQGDRGAYSVEDFHAEDIEDAALTRHLPAPGTDGNWARDNGTNWVSVANVWEPLTNGDGDNPGLIFDENGDTIMVEVVV